MLLRDREIAVDINWPFSFGPAAGNPLGEVRISGPKSFCPRQRPEERLGSHHCRRNQKSKKNRKKKAARKPEKRYKRGSTLLRTEVLMGKKNVNPRLHGQGPLRGSPIRTPQLFWGTGPDETVYRKKTFVCLGPKTGADPTQAFATRAAGYNPKKGDEPPLILRTRGSQLKSGNKGKLQPKSTL